MQKSRPRKAVCKVVVERTNSAATSRKLWKGLVRFNREQAGPLRYSRTVLSVRDEKGRLLGGLITQSWWKKPILSCFGSLPERAERGWVVRLSRKRSVERNDGAAV